MKKYKPIDSLKSPRFCGIRTFMRLPHVSTVEEADFAVIGVPFDTGVTFRAGARFAPEAIRSNSVLLRPYNIALDIDIFKYCSGYDYGDLPIVPGFIEDSYEIIEKGLLPLLDQGIVPVLLGGDHSITLAELRAVAKKHGPVALIQFDSHTDTMDSYFGRRYNHGTPFRRAVEEGLIDSGHSIQVGIRGSVYSKDDLTASKEIRAAADASGINPASGAGKDPTFKILVRCPVCQRSNIECHELKAKSQKLSFDRFMAPKYTGASGFKTINYNRVTITVCPRCLFASSDKKDFITYSMTAKTEVKSQLGPMILSRLTEEIPNRKKLLGNISDPAEYFAIPRSTGAVIMSFKLAIHRVLLEAEFKLPNAYYKAGAYALRIAVIQREEKSSDEETLEEAFKHFSQCFSTSNVPNQDLENKLIYIIVALCLRLKDEKQARAYIAVLEKTKADLLEKKKADPMVKSSSVESWLNKAKNLWDDRDMEGLWNH